MNERTIQILSVTLTTIFTVVIIWLYLAEPKTISEVVTKSAVTIGTYQIDKAKFDEGLRLFRGENYAAAREFFTAADSEKRDAKTQYYISYSFYRQGFGKVYSDDNLFKQGLENLKFVDLNFKSDDSDLKLQTIAELKNEFQQGIEKTMDDLNPMKVFRERK
jgi:hypothetical protein